MIFSHSYNFKKKREFMAENQGYTRGDKNHHQVCNQATLKLHLTEMNALLDEHENS